VWIAISQYFVGIIIFLALLFALMDASRKYDKYREWPYFVIATGYFSLVVWALLRATILNQEIIDPALVGLQITGLFLLVIGYLSEHHQDHKKSLSEIPDFAHPVPETTETVPAPLLLEATTTPVVPVISPPITEEKWDIKPKPTPKITPKPEKTKAVKVELPPKEKPIEKTSGEKAEKPAKPAKKKSKEKEIPSWVALLAEDIDIPEASENEPEVLTDKKDEKLEQTSTESPIITSNPETPAESISPIVKTPTVKRSKKLDGPVDLSYLAKRKKTKKVTVSADSKPAQPEKQEQREKMLDELFPVEKDTATDEPIIDPTSAVPQSTSMLPGEHREDEANATAPSAPKTPPALNAVAFSMSSLNIDWIIANWQHTVPLVLLAILVLQTARFHKTRGNILLALGFFAILLSTVSPISQYCALALEAAGYISIGIASWMRIKGKITHHFLSVMTGIYCVILALTAVLAQAIVKDTTSLQLLLLLCTGTLITLLPIVHSVTYSHPAQTTNPEGMNE
jgi:hypothetical protein